jgi:hypothetical protein
MRCRHCNSGALTQFVDLGYAPPSNSYLTADTLFLSEKYLPLKVNVCNECWLVQTEDYADRSELFNNDYAYFSSTSKSWVDHARHYVENISESLHLTGDSYVIEIASNDGYLLEGFLDKGIPCLGIEPTSSTADVAEQKGISVVREFFGLELAKQLKSQNRTANLIIGNNVFAHVPDINDFTLGLKYLLKQDGTITLEFPHLLNLIKKFQFDTIYHEHFSYLSLGVVSRIFESVGLRIWNVETISTHGGSLRVFGCHDHDPRKTCPSVKELINLELKNGLETISTYVQFQSKIDNIKNSFIEFLIEQKNHGKRVVAYGAAAKGSTLLNFAGVKSDLLSFVCDASPAKQNKFMPGSHIPIYHPDILQSTPIDYLVVFPWNISAEIVRENKCLKDSGVTFVIVVPEIKIL